MTGPEHYLEAERLLTEAVGWDANSTARDELVIAAAQVHATLALAAATALQFVETYHELDEDAVAWAEALG